VYIFWAILGILFLFLEFLKSNIYKLTLASTFLFCAIIAYKFPKDILYQVISLFSFGFLFYMLIKKSFQQEQKYIQNNKKLDNFIGKQAKVIKDIGKTLSIDGLGYIEYNNQLWSAKSINDKEIKAGNTVEIISKENKIMNVKVVDNAKK
jgi:membrane protein implicated in regulation of membrane protease activity